MKKTLLFDDQRTRSERLQAEFPIHKWEHVMDISHANPSKDWKFIWDYDCIILHRSSFSDNQRKTISEKAKSLKKYLVFFSGNYSSVQLTEDGRQISSIYDRQLYQHLPAFSKTVHKDDKIELRVLAFGKKYILEEALRQQEKLLAPLFFFSGSDLLPPETMEDSYLKELNRLQEIIPPDLLSDEDEDIPADRDSLNGLTVQEMRRFVGHRVTLLSRI